MTAADLPALWDQALDSGDRLLIAITGQALADALVAAQAENERLAKSAREHIEWMRRFTLSKMEHTYGEDPLGLSNLEVVLDEAVEKAASGVVPPKETECERP